eukprot:6226776-Alexandrium_andersonii.AAC.1
MQFLARVRTCCNYRTLCNSSQAPAAVVRNSSRYCVVIRSDARCYAVTRKSLHFLTVPRNSMGLLQFPAVPCGTAIPARTKVAHSSAQHNAVACNKSPSATDALFVAVWGAAHVVLGV